MGAPFPFLVAACVKGVVAVVVVVAKGDFAKGGSKSLKFRTTSLMHPCCVGIRSDG